MEPYDYPSVGCQLAVKHLRTDVQRLAVAQALSPIEVAWALTFLASETAGDTMREAEDAEDDTRE